MAERVLRGAAAAPGLAVGPAVLLSASAAARPERLDPDARPAEALAADGALDAAARQLDALAERLRGRGLGDEADVVATGVLMAADPGLRARVRDLVAQAGWSAPAAILAATEAEAAAIAAIPDPTLAARAADVRSLGRRAARLAQAPGSAGAAQAPAEASVLVADDLGPADVAELAPQAAAIALAAGAPTAHAAIVARSLGIPMAVGLGEDVLRAEPGAVLVVDGDRGQAIADPAPGRVAAAREAIERRRASHDLAVSRRDLPAETSDGRRLRVLANVASAIEAATALEYGAEGAGLIRTELAFLEAPAWPDEDAHRRALGSVLGALAGRPATVRVLDFGGDKTPPFLRGTTERGLALLLGAPDALAAQLRATLDAGRGCELRILLPMVADAAELAAASALLDSAAAAVGVPRPLLGAMVETPAAAHAAAALAARSDFLSIGTNDLTCATLGHDRFAGAGGAPTHDPRVLAHIAACASAAHAAGRFLEVCGEAASNPLTVPLLLGLGVDELSVGAARVGSVRAWIRVLRHSDAAALATRALAAPSAAAVERLAAPAVRALELAEGADAAAQDGDGVGRVAAIGA